MLDAYEPPMLNASMVGGGVDVAAVWLDEIQDFGAGADHGGDALGEVGEIVVDHAGVLTGREHAHFGVAVDQCGLDQHGRVGRHGELGPAQVLVALHDVQIEVDRDLKRLEHLVEHFAKMSAGLQASGDQVAAEAQIRFMLVDADPV